jgi:hypothetical protein
MAEILGHMFQFDTHYTIAIAATDTDYIIDNMTCGMTRGMIFQNGQEFKIVTPGIYQVSWQLSFTASSANQDIESGIGLNGDLVTGTSAHSKITTATDTKSVSGVGCLICAANDLIQLVTHNETSTADVIVEHCHVMILLETQRVG